MDNTYGPNCRISYYYYPTREAATRARRGIVKYQKFKEECLHKETKIIDCRVTKQGQMLKEERCKVCDKHIRWISGEKKGKHEFLNILPVSPVFFGQITNEFLKYTSEYNSPQEITREVVMGRKEHNKFNTYTKEIIVCETKSYWKDVIEKIVENKELALEFARYCLKKREIDFIEKPQITIFNENIESVIEQRLYENIKNKLPKNCCIIPQYNIPQTYYKVDFFITDIHENIKLVIECDSYEWHHKTPDQILFDYKRMRKIISLGYTYFPFTGRELHSEPTECVKEILNLLERINNL
ncbi:MAG TPA: DUF559 domain-containing protein [Atribacterota bacterium]|nr:DUF559 domain-containing protein [Atribacterota bacterium]